MTRNPVEIEAGPLWSTKQRDAHPIHEISYRACFKPALAGYFIERFSSPGDIVLDPFMGRGTTPIETALRGRIATGSDANPLCEMLAAPRLHPPTIEEVAEWLHGFDWNSSMKSPPELLAFYHPATLQNLCALREKLLAKPLDQTSAWIRMVALNRLTGHSPGFFSVRTLPPNQAVSHESQLAINSRLGQTPPLRDISELILKKNRSLLRQPVRFDHLLANKHHLWTGAAELPCPLPDGSATLVVTSPPFLNVVDYRRDNWLRCWFAGIDSAMLPSCTGSLDKWAENLTSAMRQMRRFLKPGGHAAIEVGEIRKGTLPLEETVVNCGENAEVVPIKTSSILNLSQKPRGAGEFKITPTGQIPIAWLFSGRNRRGIFGEGKYPSLRLVTPCNSMDADRLALAFFGKGEVFYQIPESENPIDCRRRI